MDKMFTSKNGTEWRITFSPDKSVVGFSNRPTTDAENRAEPPKAEPVNVAIPSDVVRAAWREL